MNSDQQPNYDDPNGGVTPRQAELAPPQQGGGASPSEEAAFHAYANVGDGVGRLMSQASPRGVAASLVPNVPAHVEDGADRKKALSEETAPHPDIVGTGSAASAERDADLPFVDRKGVRYSHEQMATLLHDNPLAYHHILTATLDSQVHKMAQDAEKSGFPHVGTPDGGLASKHQEAAHGTAHPSGAAPASSHYSGGGGMRGETPHASMPSSPTTPAAHHSEVSVGKDISQKIAGAHGSHAQAPSPKDVAAEALGGLSAGNAYNHIQMDPGDGRTQLRAATPEESKDVMTRGNAAEVRQMQSQEGNDQKHLRQKAAVEALGAMGPAGAVLDPLVGPLVKGAYKLAKPGLDRVGGEVMSSLLGHPRIPEVPANLSPISRQATREIPPSPAASYSKVKAVDPYAAPTKSAGSTVSGSPFGRQSAEASAAANSGESAASAAVKKSPQAKTPRKDPLWGDGPQPSIRPRTRSQMNADAAAQGSKSAGNMGDAASKPGSLAKPSGTGSQAAYPGPTKITSVRETPKAPQAALPASKGSQAALPAPKPQGLGNFMDDAARQANRPKGGSLGNDTAAAKTVKRADNVNTIKQNAADKIASQTRAKAQAAAEKAYGIPPIPHHPQLVGGHRGDYIGPDGIKFFRGKWYNSDGSLAH